MAKKIETFFPTYIYRDSLSKKKDLNSRLEHEIALMIEKDKAGIKWSQEGYQNGYSSYGSNHKLHEQSGVFAELMEHIAPAMAAFIKELHWKIDVKSIYPTGVWANAMGRGARHGLHQHPGAVLSGVYYVNAPKGAAPFVFEDPRMGYFMAAPERKKTAPRHDQNQVLLNPKAGDFILFESWLKHEVPEHFADEPRLSVAFNYGIVS